MNQQNNKVELSLAQLVSMFTLYIKFRQYVSSGPKRSVLAKKNIIGAILNKGVAIIISLLLVPTTIDYLDTEQYGIWLTISSLISWISYFDIGLVHGFKNKFAEAKANGDKVLAQQYVSTTYASLIMIFGVILLIAECLCPLINWANVLNVSESYRLMLSKICAILFFFTAIQLILGVLPALLTADQRPAYASMITTIGQGLALIVICIITLLPNKDMLYICIALGGLPCIVLTITSVICFTHQYKDYAPSIRRINPKLIGNIVNLGGKFFIIQISMLLIFQVTNIVLSRTLGPESVTLYNVTYKYFSIIQMAFNILLSPFWVAYTDAYTKKDFIWMRSAYRKLNKIYYLAMIVGVIMFLISPWMYKIWLPDYISISWELSLAMCIYILILSYSNMVMILINGTGKVFLQMITYACCALVAIPLMILLCKQMGIIGILIVLGGVYALQSIIATIQLKKILENVVYGVWSK